MSMSDLDLDSQAILNGLVYLDRHQQLQPNSLPGKPSKAQRAPNPANASPSQKAVASAADPNHPESESVGTNNTAAAIAPEVGTAPAANSNGATIPVVTAAAAAAAAAQYSGVEGPRAIAHLKVETSAVLKELARFRACDDETMSCFYCREWSQWIYRKQISHSVNPNAVQASGSNKKKKKNQRHHHKDSPSSAQHQLQPQGNHEKELDKDKNSPRLLYKSVDELCQSLRELVSEEEERWKEQREANDDESASRSSMSSPAPSLSGSTSAKGKLEDVSSSRPTATAAAATAATATVASAPAAAVAAAAAAATTTTTTTTGATAMTASTTSSNLIDTIINRVTQWYQGYTFPLAEDYDDVVFEFHPESYSYEDPDDPLNPALLLPVLEVSKSFISLSSQHFPLLGNITSDLIATHTYPTCQHNKADHQTPSELECQRVIFNSQLARHRKEFKVDYDREMEPVWQITQLLLKSIQRIEAMRVRLFTRGSHLNQQQFMQSIKNKAQPFTDYWVKATEPYRSSDPNADAKSKQGRGMPSKSGSNSSEPTKAKSPEQLAKEIDQLFHKHLENTLEACNSWSRTFLESYYGVAREFARELETILGECITMCDRRAQGLNYPPALSLEPRVERARAAIARLHPQLEAHIENIQATVRDRNEEIFCMTEEIRNIWDKESGSSVQSKFERASQKEFRKRLKRLEFFQHTKVIAWSMDEIERLLTSTDVAWVAIDCIELLMTEAETLERAVSQVFMRKLEDLTTEIREQRQFILEEFNEGIATGREELAGIIGKLLLKEAWRILESNISLQRQNALLGLTDEKKGGQSKSEKKAQTATVTVPESIDSTDAFEDGYGPPSWLDPPPSETGAEDQPGDGGASGGKKKKKKNKKKKKSKNRSAGDDDTISMADSGTIDATDVGVETQARSELDIPYISHDMGGSGAVMTVKSRLDEDDEDGDDSDISRAGPAGEDGGHMFMIDQLRLAEMYNEAVRRNKVLENEIMSFKDQVLDMQRICEKYADQLCKVRKQEIENKRMVERLRADSEKWHQWYEMVRGYFESLKTYSEEVTAARVAIGARSRSSRRQDERGEQREAGANGQTSPSPAPNDSSSHGNVNPESDDNTQASLADKQAAKGLPTPSEDVHRHRSSSKEIEAQNSAPAAFSTPPLSSSIPVTSASVPSIAAAGVPVTQPGSMPDLSQLFPAIASGSVPIAGIPMPMNWNEIPKSAPHMYSFSFHPPPPPPPPPSFGGGGGGAAGTTPQPWGGPGHHPPHPAMTPDMAYMMMRSLYTQAGGQQPFTAPGSQDMNRNASAASSTAPMLSTSVLGGGMPNTSNPMESLLNERFVVGNPLPTDNSAAIGSAAMPKTP